MIAKIKYLGYSSFLIQTYDGVSVVTDPFNDTIGFSMPQNLKADIVLVSHNHSAHNCTEAVKGHPSVIQGPGCRELGWVKIKGIAAYHDKQQGAELGKNTIFCWDMRAIKFCHLGDLGHTLSDEIIQEIGQVDVLFLPIGGKHVIGLDDAEKVESRINCKYVIPMHYKTKYFPNNCIYGLEEFIGTKNNTIIPEPKNEFVIDRTALAVKTKFVVAMEYCVPN